MLHKVDALISGKVSKSIEVIGYDAEQGCYVSCCVPCDHVPVRSWPLFRAREVMLALIESFAQEQPS